MKTIRQTLSLLSLLLAAVLLVSCGASASDRWKTAAYTADTTLGEGATSFRLEVTDGEKTVTFTVKTDETNLGAALLALGLVGGEQGPYGLYVKVVNGITADYDVDGAYWAFLINGEMAMTGIDGVTVDADAIYRLAYTK